MNHQDLDHFYLQKEEPIKSCLLTLRSIILSQNEHISETQKYGMPCFMLKKKILCYLWIDKKLHEPYILMADGKLLDHPQLEQDNRKRMKIFRVNSQADLPIKTIEMILKNAINLHCSHQK